MEQIRKRQEEWNQLRRRFSKLVVEEKELPEADRRRFSDLKFESDVVSLQLYLIIYEKQSWKLLKDDIEQRVRQNEEYLRVARCCLALLDLSFGERLERLIHSWPKLAPVHVKDTNLFDLDPKQAEQTIASLLKTSEAQLVGKKKVRELLALAKTYRLQQRLFQLAYLRRGQIIGEQAWPRPASLPLSDPAALIGPVAPPPPARDPYAAGPFLDALASCARTREEILQTWIDYQIVRLDLYRDIGMSPP